MDTQPAAFGEQAAEAVGATSALDRLRAVRGRLATQATLDLAVPGWDGRLVARYRAITDRRVFARMATETDPETDLDFIAAACDGLYLDGEPIADERGRLTYDDRLADALGLEAEQGRDVVRAVIDQGNVVAAAEHARRVLDWMRDTSQRADASALGE